MTKDKTHQWSETGFVYIGVVSAEDMMAFWATCSADVWPLYNNLLMLMSYAEDRRKNNYYGKHSGSAAC